MSNRTCSVVGCKNVQLKCRGRTPPVTFYSLPGRPYEAERRKLWIAFTRRKNSDGTPWQPTQNSRICSDHFVNNVKCQNPLEINYNPTIYNTNSINAVENTSINSDAFVREMIMVKTCCAYNCRQKGCKGGPSFHRFPRDPELKRKWLVAIRRSALDLTRHSALCGRHFTKECFYVCPKNGVKKMLLPGSVPSLFHFPIYPQRKRTKYGHPAFRNIAAAVASKQASDYVPQDKTKDSVKTLESFPEPKVCSDEAAKKADDMANDFALPRNLPPKSKMSVTKTGNKFLENWNPENSNRETRKLTRKLYREGNHNCVYDSRGRLMKHGMRNVCDCLEEGCPGCHMPCPRCDSTKCGHECRVNRRWTYESVEIEGKDVVFKNKYK